MVVVRVLTSTQPPPPLIVDSRSKIIGVDVSNGLVHQYTYKHYAMAIVDVAIDIPEFPITGSTSVNTDVKIHIKTQLACFSPVVPLKTRNKAQRTPN